MTPTADGQPLLDILKCARPVLFANEDRDWPLSNSGTAFIVAYRRRHFVITAKHCLNLKNFQAEQFRIQYRPDSGEFLPLRHGYTAAGIEALDDEHDVAVWDVHEGQLQAELFGEYTPYTLLMIDRNTLYNPHSAYLYRGFPVGERNFDSDKRSQDQPSVSTRAEYVRRTKVPGLHELRLVNDGSLKSLDGFSGSPVFQVAEDGGNYSREAFAGMLVRGTVESGRAYMLEHRCVFDALEMIGLGAVLPDPAIAPPPCPATGS